MTLTNEQRKRDGSSLMVLGGFFMIQAIFVLIGALWLSGLPPFGSFFSKYLLGMAASEFSPVLTIIITGTAIITLGYLLRPIRSFLRIA